MVGNRLGYPTYVLQAGAFLSGPFCLSYMFVFSSANVFFCVLIRKHDFLFVFIVKTYVYNKHRHRTNYTIMYVHKSRYVVATVAAGIDLRYCSAVVKEQKYKSLQICVFACSSTHFRAIFCRFLLVSGSRSPAFVEGLLGSAEGG